MKRFPPRSRRPKSDKEPRHTRSPRNLSFAHSAPVHPFTLRGGTRIEEVYQLPIRVSGPHLFLTSAARLMAPTTYSMPALFSRLRAYYAGVEPEAPVISTSSAVLLLVRMINEPWACADILQIAYTLIYVLPFYISPTTRPSPQLSRDAPSVIRGRIRLVTWSCIVCSTGTFVLLSSVGGGSPLKSLHFMGYWPLGAIEAVRNTGLTGILFLGPLFEAGVAEGRWRDWIRFRGLSSSIGSWIGWRNLVAVCYGSPALVTT